MSTFETRLAELGVTLPDAPAPAANYVPSVITGDTVYISGQISQNPDGSFITGKVGADLSVEEGAAAAQTCAISLLAQVKAACGGDLDRLVRVVKLVGFVNSHGDFTEQPKVINGASDFLVEALGDAGKHARSAVSAGALPFNVAVEIEGIFQIKP
ncbi:enamine deaminase RidA (YjgF/YER057c/UK114 family) [Litoreibacter ponti]|uniref:Enamine deaminase RidA (YjgF/YER057c/UK114 family) n=1 Tax=Litoreibacter ponti TaxID=1510457 RepID=A0A2T6BPW3_9RHOB|nr:RidA family protein [Litoreibacter ponti]PTX58086.1 enamine deaminase RidA (YjgF/YER057c/UK114 family) [Litoreibacter ponti]